MIVVATLVTVTVEAVTVIGAAVTVLYTCMVDWEPTAVEIVLTVVVDGVMERQEQAEEMADDAKAVR